MKNKDVKGILALAVVTALSFGVIAGSKALSVDMDSQGESSQAQVLEEYDVSGFETIEKAEKTSDGYLVTVREKGYVADVVLQVAFADDAATITRVEVLEQSETESLGSRIAEPEFLDQFQNKQAPVYLPGMSLDGQEEAPAPGAALEGAALSDGTYEASSSGPDASGFVDQVTITVENGAIASVNWESVTEDGSKKSVMSENGEYVMTEDGLTWKEQAEALAAALVENQSLGFLTTNEEGKTDAVSGVSISVGGFISLAEQCLMQAAGMEAPAPQEAAPQDGTLADAVSGATRSSTAAVTGINDAYNFLQTVK